MIFTTFLRSSVFKCKKFFIRVLSIFVGLLLNVIISTSPGSVSYYMKVLCIIVIYISWKYIKHRNSICINKDLKHKEINREYHWFTAVCSFCPCPHHQLKLYSVQLLTSRSQQWPWPTSCPHPPCSDLQPHHLLVVLRLQEKQREQLLEPHPHSCLH